MTFRSSPASLALAGILFLTTVSFLPSIRPAISLSPSLPRISRSSVNFVRTTTSTTPRCVRVVGASQEPSSSATRDISGRRGVMKGAFRGLGSLAIVGGGWGLGGKSFAFDSVPAGYARVQSKLDGYRYAVPDTWLLSKTSGNLGAYENPLDYQQNIFIAVSGVTKFDSPTDIGTPQEVAKDVERRLLNEFMSTRIGVRRDSDIISAKERTGKDGKVYYDITVRVKSYASRNQLAVSQEAIDAAIELEFDRTYITTIGVANNKVYDLRLQTASETYPSSSGVFDTILNSFEVANVKCPSMTSCKANGAKIVKSLPTS
ncbi:hypothetical protein AAMO2058_000244400 [Amorphochlora amoebiformis]